MLVPTNRRSPFFAHVPAPRRLFVVLRGKLASVIPAAQAGVKLERMKVVGASGMQRTLMLFVLFALSVHHAGSAQTDDTRTVADRYVELQLELDYDSLGALYADDATFFDPTADVFGEGSQSLAGADSIIEMQRGWGFDGMRYEADESFSVGEYFLTRGALGIRWGGSDGWTDLPFVMVLRIRSGQVLERIDLAEYVESFALGGELQEKTASTKRIAEEYLAAYLSSDLDAQERLMAPGAQFQDPTAAVFGPGLGDPIDGAEEILSRRAGTFQNITAFDLVVEESFVSNHHAVFMGQTTYELRDGTRYAQPAVFVIEVKDGKITRHWDYVDYSIGPIGN